MALAARFAVTVGAILVLGLAGGATAGARAEPAVALDRTQVALGEELAVRLAGWPPGNVLVELCGNGADRGSIDCAVGTGVTAAVRADGSGSVALTVSTPPSGCPCVVRVRPILSGVTVTVPVVVRGVPVQPAPPAGRVPTALAASGVRVAGAGSSWASIFGGPAHRTVTVTLNNTGQAPVLAPRLRLTSGRPGRTDVIVPAPGIELLEPGQRRTFDLPVTFGAPTWGRYAVRGELLGADQPAVFYAHTYSYPWGLLVLPALAIGLAMRRRWRRIG
ncbi:hypothetical protein ACIBF5_08485 [Micromonospora sp. NPDC050417]|uniref:hypothetical protein n=1 Tax=Micromonospora sp. NPDC050417 TaxID=3364280 RepID=UPI0037A2AF8C